MISRRSSIFAALRFFTCLFAGSSFTWAPSSRRGPAPLRVASTKKITAATDHELTLGAPRDRPSSSEYTTRGGVLVNVAVNTVQNPDAVIERMVDALDSRLGKSQRLHIFPFLFLSTLHALAAIYVSTQVPYLHRHTSFQVDTLVGLSVS